MIRNNFERVSAWRMFVTFNDWYESDSSKQYAEKSFTDVNQTFCVVCHDLWCEIIYVSRSKRNTTWPAFRMVCISRILFLKRLLKLISFREGNDWNSKLRFSQSHSWKCEPVRSLLITVVDFGLYFMKQI